MSKYEEESDYEDRICPYCGHRSFVEPEGYGNDGEEEKEECEECGKFYHASISFSVSFVARPDCEINGAKHAWEPFQFENGRSHDFCAVCGKCRKIVGGEYAD